MKTSRGNVSTALPAQNIVSSVYILLSALTCGREVKRWWSPKWMSRPRPAPGQRWSRAHWFSHNKCVYLCTLVCLCAVIVLQGFLFCQCRQELENVPQTCTKCTVCRKVNVFRKTSIPYWGDCRGLVCTSRQPDLSSQNVLSDLMQQLFL